MYIAGRYKVQYMDHNTKIRFAVIGCGHIGKRHAAMISTNPDCELVALADSKEAGSLNTADYKVPFFSSIEELLKTGLPFDVLCVATPNGLHEEHALKGLRAGKHVVIEKPMALTKAGCEHIIYESLQQHRQVFCVMQNRYSPPAVWLKAVIEKELLGKIYMVQVNCFWNRDERYYKKGNWHGTKTFDGGVLFTQFSHFIDTLLWLFGGIENISARFANFSHQQLTEFADSGSVNFNLPNGGMGAINFSTAVWEKNLESSITIIAEKGTVKIGGQYMNEVQYCNIKDHIMPKQEPGTGNNHYFVFENIVNVLKQRVKDDSTANDGMKVVETIERIYKS